ncbi:MAG TPA: Rieske 2Fe-2S domain-containing protein [Vicinamibacterales bacterium]
MPKFTTHLIDRVEVAQGTLAFTFERPEGLDYVAGQHVTIALTDPLYSDEKGNSRIFSIASSPQDAERLAIATRMTGSALKRSLAEAPFATPVSLIGPAGTFALRPAQTLVVFIAGGIGITPFRSMVLDAIARGLPYRITLIYSNRTPEGAAYHAEFARMAQAHPAFTYVPTMTDAGTSGQPWAGERRTVSADFLRDHVGDIAAPTFYIAGPPGLVAAATKTVLDAGADPERVFAEEFAGYAGSQARATSAATPGTPGFVKVAEAGSLAAGQMRGLRVNGREILICRVGERYFAIANECPHAGGVLSEGELLGQVVTCPLHGAAFDVTNGAVLEPPAEEGVRCYPVRVVNGAIEVDCG